MPGRPRPQCPHPPRVSGHRAVVRPRDAELCVLWPRTAFAASGALLPPFLQDAKISASKVRGQTNTGRAKQAENGPERLHFTVGRPGENHVERGKGSCPVPRQPPPPRRGLAGTRLRLSRWRHHSGARGPGGSDYKVRGGGVCFAECFPPGHFPCAPTAAQFEIGGRGVVAGRSALGPFARSPTRSRVRLPRGDKRTRTTATGDEKRPHRK